MADKTWSQEGGMSRRRQEVAPGEYAEEVYLRDAWSSAIALGNAFVIGAGVVTFTVAGNLRVLLTNPAGSGVNVTIAALSATSTATVFASFYGNPTTGLPTGTVRPRFPLRPSSNAGVTQMLADQNATTALSGGTDSGVALGIPANARTFVSPFGKILAPGESIGVNIPFSGAGTAAFSCYVIEE